MPTLLELYAAAPVIPKPPPGPAPSPNGHATAPPYAAVPPGTTVLAGDRDNFGTVEADNGDTCTVHFVSPSGQHASKELPKAQLRLQNGQPLTGPGQPSGRPTSPPPMPLRQIVADYPNLREPVIDKLLRQGETMNVIASPKAGKSWLAAGLAMAVAAGWEWLDLFKCHVGRVLVIDAELHPENIAHRYPWIASELQMPDEYADRIDVWALRGKGENLFTLADRLWQIEPGYYSLVLLDAWYRFLPPGVSENDNAAVMSLYNAVDSYADRLQSAWVNIHHASKGDQSDKGTTDVGSGAGSQSRAADCHLIVRPHEEDGLAVVDAVVRSFPPVESFVIRWELPLWWPANHADPRQLRTPESAKRARQKKRDEEGETTILNALAQHGPGTNRDLRGWTGIHRDRLQKLCDSLESKEQVSAVEVRRRGNACKEYSLPPASDQSQW